MPRASIIPALLFMMLMGAAPALALERDGPVDLALSAEYLALKKQFEAEAPKARDPRALSGLGLYCATLAWAMAAEAATRGESLDTPLPLKTPWPKRITEFKKTWRANKDAQAKERTALTLYYQALTDLLWASARYENNVRAEVRALTNHIESRLSLLDNLNANIDERRMVLSGGLVNLMAILVKHKGGPGLAPAAQGIVDGLLEKAVTVNARKDVHHHARMELLYLGNLGALTQLIFLLGHGAGPPLSRELLPVHSAWVRQTENKPMPKVFSLTWAAQAQASLPLAYWAIPREEGRSAAATH